MPRILLPMPARQWRPPSQAQAKNCFGHENRTYWFISYRLHDGFLRWRGRFEDRDDADAFLFAAITGTLNIERPLWELPVPCWHPDIMPDPDAGKFYIFIQSFLTTPTGSNQTWTSPADWNSANNTIECIGGGGSGGNKGAGQGSAGAGAGAWNSISNFVVAVPGTTTATWQTATGGAGTAINTNGNAGGDTWFNATAFPTASPAVGARGGALGPQGSGAQSGGLGGATANNFPVGGNAGGRGGNASGTCSATGGGGAGGKFAAGNNGGDSSSADSAGGQGDGTFGGTGGAGGGGATGNPGNPGTEYDASHGSGGGGGGNSTGGTNSAGAGGNYGAASGSRQGGTTATNANGAPGLIVINYVPAMGAIML